MKINDSKIRNRKLSWYPGVEINFKENESTVAIDSPWINLEVDYDKPKDAEALNLELMQNLIYLPLVHIHSDETTETLDTNASAIRMSTIGNSNKCDPLSFLTAIRYQFVKNTQDDEPFPRIVENLSNLATSSNTHAQENWRQLVALNLRQNHYVTEHAERIILLAAKNFPQAKAALLDFAEEESGHENLIADSIQKLGFDWQDIPVLFSTKETLNCLETAAKESVLAFAATTNIFEGTPFEDEDPWCKVIRQRPEYHAAQNGVQKHFKINRDLDHACAGFSFVQDIEAVPTSHANDAWCLASICQLKMTRSVYEFERLTRLFGYAYEQKFTFDSCR